MFLRYFACIDESPLGHTAAAYCDALVATGVPVRLVPTRVAELQAVPGEHCASIWDRHRGLLVTPTDGPFINLVCGDVAGWARHYTNGVTNALLLGRQHLVPTDDESGLTLYFSDAAREMRRYELVYVGSNLQAGIVKHWTDFSVTPTVVRLGDPEAADAFRNLMVF